MIKPIRIIAVILILNFLYVPFLCNEYFGKSEGNNAWYFWDTLEDLDERDPDVKMIDIVYYWGGLACASLILISTLLKKEKACAFWSIAGICSSLYVLYHVCSGNTIFYVGLHTAQLAFGFYVSLIGFIATLMLSLHTKQE